MTYRDHRDALILKLQQENRALKADMERSRAELTRVQQALTKAAKWEGVASLLRKEVTRLTLDLSALGVPFDPYQPDHRPGRDRRYRKNNVIKDWDDYAQWLDGRIEDQTLDFVEVDEVETESPDID